MENTFYSCLDNEAAYREHILLLKTDDTFYSIENTFYREHILLLRHALPVAPSHAAF
jgi:hypothetical protein